MPAVGRGANPAALLVVVFILLALFVFLGGGRKKDKSDSDSSAYGEGRGRDRGKGHSDEESDLESGRPRSRSRSEKPSRRRGKDDRGESPTSSEDEKDRAKRKEREKRKRREEEKRKKREEEKNMNKKKAEQEAAAAKQSQSIAQEIEVPRASAPDLPTAQNSALTDKMWERDPSKRPERPSGRSPPILLKRDENNQWTRPPLSGKKGVSFDDGGQVGKEASKFVTYNQDDPTNVIYDASHTQKLGDFNSRERGGYDGGFPYGKLDGSQSPLNDLLKMRRGEGEGQGQGVLSEKLIVMMRNVEHACLVDHLDLIGKMPGDLLRQTGEVINTESFIPDIGMVPQVIIDIIRQLLIEQTIDLPLIISSQSQPHIELLDPNVPYDPSPETLYENKVQPLGKGTVESNFVDKHLVRHGVAVGTIIRELGYQQWSRMKSEEIRKIVHTWTTKKLEEASQPQARANGNGNGNRDEDRARDRFLTIKLMLGYFLPYFRAYSSSKARTFLKEEKVPGFDERVGPVNKAIVDWFRYIGKCLLVAKMFSRNGTLVNDDCSLKVRISKRAKQVGFVLDYTLFVPKFERDLKTIKRPIVNSMLAANKIKGLALQWVDHLNENVYPQSDPSLKMFNDMYPFQITRLTFRPNGVPVNEMSLKSVKYSLENPLVTTSNGSGREPMIMHVDSKRMEELYESMKRSGGLADMFGRMYRSMGCQMVRFINKKPYHWYRHHHQQHHQADQPNTGSVYEKFDEKTLECLLVLIGPSLSKLTYEETFKDKMLSQVVTDAESALSVNWGDTIKYTTVQAIDFGGIVPLGAKSQTQSREYGPGQVDGKFLKLDPFQRLKWILLPLILQQKQLSKNQGEDRAIYSANLICNSSFGLIDQLYGFDSISITFQSNDPNDKNRLINELAQTLVLQIPIWTNEFKGAGTNANTGTITYIQDVDNEVIRRKVLERLDITKQIIRNQIKFIVIPSNRNSNNSYYNDEQEGDNTLEDEYNPTLSEFDIPNEMLPPGFA
ncbi:uncharacterized protein I303_103986 [Kwoniella dejecticola CBS 10117]|uniref:Uncharacterized protein n=1 Tax=Kwoniella dejecticola CBS 10117 TaxID=1296121 RepID=A0A1A6A8A2_9TREE|nr:uncharacterized protein I303_04003 [Kwoniella dejecticola CBS 10117]OBR86281.1 hypothetical protein I303_04003 [Kwoniella dejecticola CBS 10117]